MSIHEAAANGDIEGVRQELSRRVAVDVRDEQDYTPLGCAARSPDADETMLRFLLDAGADINASLEEGKYSPVGVAACFGTLSKTKYLLDAGADVNYLTPHGYTIPVNVMYARHSDEQMTNMLDLLIQHGADIDRASDWGESPVSVASRNGRFDVVAFLLDAGAKSAPLKWTPLMKALALGTYEDVRQQMQDSPSLDARDRFDRTPWLLAATVGNLLKLQLLYSTQMDVDQRGRMGETALMISAGSGHEKMLNWLIEHGADIEAADDSGNTPLMYAAGAGQAECVKRLLAEGAVAIRRNQHEETAISTATDEAIIRLLMDAGDDLSEISTEMKRLLIGLPERDSLHVSEKDYLKGRTRRFGQTNPELMKIPFWDEMIRAGVNAYQPRKKFNDTERLSEPVWCFDRFGMSFTELPDGRFVQIGGEHEDYYDPDFCIYNEVIVHTRTGQFEVMGYPEDVFPATDFHTATYVDGFIYIVGSLGYHGTRQFGTTPVYRLDCRTWKIQPVKTSGDNPGWIFKHKASFDGGNGLVISEGTICKEIDGEEQNVANEDRFVLDLRTMKWSRK